MSAISDDDCLSGFAVLAADSFHSLHHFSSGHDRAKDCVVTIEMGRRHCGDEELTAVGVGTSVGHRQQVGSVVLEFEVFVVEFGSIDGLAASAVASSEVAALTHELRDDSVELGTLVVQRLAELADALLARAQSSEVL